MTAPQATSPLLAGTAAMRFTLPRRAALYLQGSIVLSFLAASTAPSPLYGVYRQMWGFSPLTLTLVFASYAIALLAALLVLGRLSDFRGRKPLTLAALLLELVAMWLFWQADSVAWLFAARILQGVATGIVASAVSASLLDFHPAKGPLVNSLAPMFGMALGALGAAGFVQYDSAPTHSVYVALVIIFIAQAALAAFLPETVGARPGAWRSLRPDASVPRSTQAAMWRVMPVNLAQWALGGFLMSLGPTLVKTLSGSATPLLGGALIAVLVLAAAVAILFVRLRDPRSVLTAGAGLLAAGLAAVLLAIAAGHLVLLFIGAAVAGLGFGAAFNASVRSLVGVTAPQERAGMMSAFFVFSYLAFSVPAIAAGLSAGFFGLLPTAIGYGAVLVVLCTWVFVQSLKGPRS